MFSQDSKMLSLSILGELMNKIFQSKRYYCLICILISNLLSSYTYMTICHLKHLSNCTVITLDWVVIISCIGRGHGSSADPEHCSDIQEQTKEPRIIWGYFKTWLFLKHIIILNSTKLSKPSLNLLNSIFSILIYYHKNQL